MILILEVINHNGFPASNPLSARFDESGGSIGRWENNQLILPDKTNLISRNHAVIEYANGIFIYTDKSANGTELCGENRTLIKDTVVLTDGDRLKIGEYELLVRIETEGEDKTFIGEDYPLSGQDGNIAQVDTSEQTAWSLDDWIPWEEKHQSFSDETVVGNPKNTTLPFQNDVYNASDETVIFSEALGKVKVHTVVPDEKAGRMNSVETLENSKKPSLHTPNTNSFVEKQPSLVSNVTKSLESDLGVNLFQCFLEGAGLELPPSLGIEEQAEAMKTLGLVFRHTVDGMMTMLKARAAEKYEIRAGITRIHQEHSNPLKLTKVEAAMRAMLFQRRYREMGYLDPVSSVQESFTDIMNHEMAMRKAMQASLAAILQTFDPALFGESQVSGGVFQSKKTKCWEAYCVAYPKLADEAMEGLFKGVFIQAYEEQVRRLNEAHGKN